MKLHVQTFIIRVVTTDPNPASTSIRIEGAVAAARDTWGDIALTASAEPAGNEQLTVTIPDAPKGGRAYDDWFNEHVIPALET
jgi:hypothetical protein